MSIKRIVAGVLGALVIGFVILNFEGWLAYHSLDNLFTDFETKVREMDFSLTWAEIGSAINRFMISDFAMAWLSAHSSLPFGTRLDGSLALKVLR